MTTLTHLQRLEAESISIMRDAVSESQRPVMLYSIGKDSAVMLHLARKAFYPGKLPFPLLHVDTTWKFQDMYRLRDRTAQQIGAELIVHRNPEAVAAGINPFDHGSALHTDIWKTEGLKQAIEAGRFDLAFGGARRDEEKSRAKERIFSVRTRDHRWDPKQQRPDLQVGRPYLLKIGARTVTATVTAPSHKVDVNTMEHLSAETLQLNEIGDCEVALDRPVPFDPYNTSRDMGGFILIDRLRNTTVAAGFIRSAVRAADNVHWQATDVDKAAHAALKGHYPCVVWFTGVPSSGKSTLANLVQSRLHSLGQHTYLLDGDNVRHGLSSDLGFSPEDRAENIRRVGEVARLSDRGDRAGRAVRGAAAPGAAPADRRAHARAGGRPRHRAPAPGRRPAVRGIRPPSQEVPR